MERALVRQGLTSCLVSFCPQDSERFRQLFV